MTFDQLKALEDEIAAKRALREKINEEGQHLLGEARKLSDDIRSLEAKLPSPKERRGIVMTAEPAKLALKPRR